MKKWFAPLLALAFLTFFVPTQAQAQVSFGPQVGLWDFDDLGIGARVNLGLGETFGIDEGPFRQMFASVNGSFILVDDPPDVDVTLLGFNANVAVPFDLNAAVTPYAGLGLNLMRTSVSGSGFSGSDSTTGLNLLGGLNFNLGALPAFVELQHSTTGAGFTSVFLGVMFGG